MHDLMGGNDVFRGESKGDVVDGQSRNIQAPLALTPIAKGGVG